MLSLLATVAEHSGHETSKTAFYIAAGILAGWAVLVGALGVTRETFPQSGSAARGVMLVSGVLMVATMATAVLTA
jgi:hypothetical protein